ncbi:MAG: hypothetical protein Q8P18_08825 [Pseudomonadota bacterium]|nr:hypothetical protein [Pseudomonadota bacterium]
MIAEAVVYINDRADLSPAPVAGDTVAVAIAYADTECNLACGALYYSWMSPMESEGSAGSLPSNLPCDTAGSDVFLGFDFGTVEPGEYSWSLHVEDACGGSSARSEGTFTVAP